MFFAIPGVGGSDLSRQMDGVERLSRAAEPGQGGKRPEDMTPEELHAVLWQILTFRDNIMRVIETTVSSLVSSYCRKLSLKLSMIGPPD